MGPAPSGCDCPASPRWSAWTSRTRRRPLPSSHRPPAGPVLASACPPCVSGCGPWAERCRSRGPTADGGSAPRCPWSRQGPRNLRSPRHEHQGRAGR
ncbi:hypothetical protein ACFFX0_06445 [Citricoccus parietis]|uniref:Uncharacterized protein n=1 Tax=Citricoccus parietis TaxID=592307 RepID=A0ABV5FVY8_9MICC